MYLLSAHNEVEQARLVRQGGGGWPPDNPLLNAQCQPSTSPVLTQYEPSTQPVLEGNSEPVIPSQYKGSTQFMTNIQRGPRARFVLTAPRAKRSPDHSPPHNPLLNTQSPRQYPGSTEAVPR